MALQKICLKAFFLQKKAFWSERQKFTTLNSDSDFRCEQIHYLVCLVIISEIFPVSQNSSIKN